MFMEGTEVKRKAEGKDRGEGRALLLEIRKCIIKTELGYAL